MPTEEEGRELLAAVHEWQDSGIAHPMTCPDHHDEVLEAHLSPALWNVYLMCPKPGCKHCQAWVPDCVLTAYRHKRMKDD